MLYLIPALRYSDTHNETIDELYSTCRLLGLRRIKVKAHFYNSRCLRKVINNSNAVAVYRLCTQGQSILQRQVRNVIHILYKGELTTQPMDNIFPCMCSMYWNKSYFNNITFGTALHHALPCAAIKLFAAVGRKGTQVTTAVSKISERRTTTGVTSMLLYAAMTMSW